MRFNTLSSALSLASLAAASPLALPAAEAEALKHGSSYATEMGPVTFLYPTVRDWSEEADNIAPCGSYASIGNRSEFPLDDGFIAFIAKYISYKVKLSISYSSNPTSQSDFEEWYNGNVTDELHIGHTCYYMPDLPQSINSGDNATIQAIYMNDDEEDETNSDGSPIEGTYNETFYVCADVTFVEESVFDLTDYAYACFNATDDDYYSESSIDVTGSDVATYDSSATAEAASVRSSAGVSTGTGTSTSSSTATASSSSSSSSQGVAGSIVNPVAGFIGVLAVIVTALI